MKYVVPIMLLLPLYAQSLDDRYHTTEEIYSFLDSLNQLEELEGWFHLDTIGFSTQENIPILAVRISDNAHVKEDEPRVLFVGQVHAEEILGVEIVLDLINDLLFPDASIHTHMSILKQYLDIWIIPTANPEGLNVVHEELDLSYRKNKRDLSPMGPFANGVFDYEPSIGNDIDGVDLNRNFLTKHEDEPEGYKLINGKVISIDLKEIDKIQNTFQIKGDFTNLQIQNDIKNLLKKKVDVVMSDMAVNTTGIKDIDSIQTGELCKEAMLFSKDIISLNGFFISKIFMGRTFNEIVALGKKIFKEVKVFKPKSSRKDSKESFIICKNLRLPL